MTNERIIFANLLRGIGALSVLISHYVGIFWLAHPEISTLMGVPEIKSFPKLPIALSMLAEYCIVFGQFGVGAFFIVSGLVIPISLKNVSRNDFLLRRSLRIYPVYIIGFCFVMFSLYSLSLYAGAAYKFSFGDILAHFGVITRGPLGVTRIDGISWTLEVEIYFYLIMCVLGGFIFNFDAKRYVAAILLVAGVAAITMKNQGYLLGVQIGSTLMLILGIAYYSLINQRISLKEFWIVQTTIAFLIPAVWFLGAGQTKYTTHWVIGYLIAMAVFYTCYAFRNKIKENRLLLHLSDISYPLYVVHALFGYAIMYVLVDKGFGVYSAITAATLSAYLASLALHVFVEKPTMSWIKQSRARKPLVQST